MQVPIEGQATAGPIRQQSEHIWNTNPCLYADRKGFGYFNDTRRFPSNRASFRADQPSGPRSSKAKLQRTVRGRRFRLPPASGKVLYKDSGTAVKVVARQLAGGLVGTKQPISELFQRPATATCRPQITKKILEGHCSLLRNKLL